MRLFISILLRLFPGRFRRRHGEDLMATFFDRWNQGAGFRLALRTLTDMLRSALLEHAAEARRTPELPKGDSTVTVIWRDLRFAVRTLIQSPGFTLAALATLALGIGATSALYSVVRSVLIKGLPYPHADRLVFLNEALPTLPQMNLSWPDYMDWRSQNRVFEEMAVFRPEPLSVKGPEGFRATFGGRVSSTFFSVLGAKASAGRMFSSMEDQPGAAPVAVASYRFWQEQLRGDPAIAGKTLVTADGPLTIVGVLAPDFRFEPWEFELYIPVGVLANTSRFQARSDHPGLQGIALLRQGVSLEAARADMKSVMERIASAYPESNRDTTAIVVPMTDRLVGPVRTSLLMLLGAVAFVLLLACANVAHLALARTTARQREFAIRAAIGASRGVLIRQVFAESTLLSLTGGALGLLGAHWGVPALTNLYPRSIPGFKTAHLDWNVFLVTLVVCVFTAAIFGLAPMFLAGRIGQNASIKEGAAGRQGRRLRSVLFVAEIAIAMVVTVGAGLLLRSLAAVLDADLGFRADHLLALDITRVGSQDTGPPFFVQAADRIARLPGVQSADAVLSPPLAGTYWTSPYQAAGAAAIPFTQLPWTAINPITPGYFETAGIRLIEGRAFTRADVASSTKVAIVNETLARQLWRGDSAAGKRIEVMYAPERLLNVIGVVADVKQFGAETPARAEVFVPAVSGFRTILVRTSIDPAGLVKPATAVIHELDPDQPVTRAAPMLNAVASGAAQRRFAAVLLSLFSGLALLLAAVGVFGVMAYTVTQRTREFGIRMAIGARRGHVLRLLLQDALWLAGLGLAIGCVAAWGLARLLENLLFQVKAHDVLTFFAVFALLSIVALLACVAPARRAALVDPARALRSE